MIVDESLLPARSRVDRRRTVGWTPSKAADRRWAVIGGRDSPRGSVDPGSGKAAIERARAEPPDVLLLDLSLPGASAAKTVSALREHADTATIGVLVRSVLPPSEEKLARSALVDWIEKPATPDALFAALDRAIGRADDVFRALFIEPDPAIALLLRALFARHGVAGYAASSGPQALAMCAQVHPDVLVLDDHLPPVDGLDVRSWLHGQSSFGELPIIAFDAGHVESAEHERRSMGTFTQILTKGQISAEEFQWRVMTLLARRHIQRRTPEPHDPKHILLVDDEHDIRAVAALSPEALAGARVSSDRTMETP
jgi:CheY-like chemotaxis protein